MQDVALRAKVSIKTVSRVVNGEVWVANETAERVRTAIAELGFRRNDMAHLLRRQQPTSTIGLVIEDLSNPFYASIARAVEAVAHERGFVFIVGSSEEDWTRERNLIRNLIGRRVEGLLLVPTAEDHAFLDSEVQRRTPVVCLDRPAPNFDTDLVLLENYEGARAAVEHLLARGHRRIAMLTAGFRAWPGAERLRGYVDALRGHGLPVDSDLTLRGCLGVSDTAEAVTRLLGSDDPPTATFAANNRAAIGALVAIARSPRKAEIVAFDDFELAELLHPPITVVAYDTAELGRLAANLLFDRIDGDDGPPRRISVPVRLVVRTPHGA